MQFDPKSKKYKHLMSYMKDKTCLVYDQASSVRQSILKVMKTYEMPITQIFHDAKNVEEVKNYILNKAPDFVFINTKIDDSKGIDVFKIHQQMNPNKLSSGFFILSEDNSLSDAALILDYDIDGYIAQPYTYDSLFEIFTNAILKKAIKDPYQIALENAKTYFVKEKFEEAAELFEAVKEIGMPSSDHCFFQGQNYLKLNQKEKAELSFRMGIEVMPTHYKCLNALVYHSFEKKNYEDAYKHMVVILANYPLNAEKIPLLTKISISNEKYEDIYKYSEIFIDLPNKKPEVQKYLVAGLVLCGKYMLLNNDNKKATRTLLDAAKLSEGRTEVLSQIVVALSEVKLFDHARNILNKYADPDGNNEDFLLLQFEILIKENKLNMIFKSWSEIKASQKNKIKNLRLFEIVLEASKEADLGKAQVESILDDAKKNFPNDLPRLKEIIAA